MHKETIEPRLIKFLIKEPVSMLKSKHDKTIFETYNWGKVIDKLRALNSSKIRYYYIQFGVDGKYRRSNTIR